MATRFAEGRGLISSVTKYRAEVVGSLLRPAYLKQARLDLAGDRISVRQFKQIEDRAVDEAIALQQASGLEVATDGEMRRSGFVAPLTDYVDGFEAIGLETLPWRRRLAEQTQLPVPFTVTGKLRRRRSLVAEEFIYARARARLPLKVTLPSPLMLALRWSPVFSAEAYPEPFELFADAAMILRDDIAELASLGCEYIQVDAPELATLVDPATRHHVYEAKGISSERLLLEGVDLLNAIADVAGVTFAIHLCRGNNAGHWMSAGGYEAISKQVFGRLTRYSILLLEYDDGRSGSFEPLSDIPRDKTVVLGLISTKNDELELVETLTDRFKQAAHYFPREQMGVSRQCGFASVAAGNPISPEMQQAKLQLVADLAQRLFG
ncbi:MAG: cobalamin-independent methionine synthase II family protein [Deltaproteobacteria bacterium]|nr:cobalamin-independent methionine synthase II family protein [Deltaproteobacteria bacterium]